MKNNNRRIITDISYSSVLWWNCSNVFSVDEKIYIIYTNKDNNIISFNVSDKIKIKEIKNSPDNKIINYRHCYDQANKRDFCISIGYSINNIKL